MLNMNHSFIRFNIHYYNNYSIFRSNTLLGLEFSNFLLILKHYLFIFSNF